MKIIVLDDSEGIASTKWDKITKIADSYSYAVHEDEKSANKNQIYQLFGNNSNTFIRYVLIQSGIDSEELPGSHPGNNSPEDVGNSYSDPWKIGQPETPRP